MTLVSACVLIRTEHGKFEDVVKALNQIKGVKKAFPVLGRYDVVAEVEAADMKELGSKVLRMSRLSGVVFTETLIEVEY
ncbi:Lrp/AsnC ligand binding domain-containing protein [Candidatus Bathyarchaeota archaeon]|nr:Lrp/AsnC ligand binding domain-containing protein [Candidatus Bathyarchaeota archaeon]